MLHPHWKAKHSSVFGLNTSDLAVDEAIESCFTTQADVSPWWAAKVTGKYIVKRVQVKQPCCGRCPVFTCMTQL